MTKLTTAIALHALLLAACEPVTPLDALEPADEQDASVPVDSDVADAADVEPPEPAQDAALPAADETCGNSALYKTGYARAWCADTAEGPARLVLGCDGTAAFDAGDVSERGAWRLVPGGIGVSFGDSGPSTAVSLDPVGRELHVPHTGVAFARCVP